MKLAVCVKHVPDGRLHLDPTTSRLDRSGSGDINPMDRYAVEEALRAKDHHGGDVVAVTMGPKSAGDALRSALSLGADRGVLLSDSSLAGSDLLATSAALAAFLEREGPDLVMFGQQTSDGGGALLWAAVAERLHWPVMSQATALTIADDSIRVTRQTEYGEDVIEAPLPAIIAVTDAINEPRYASLKQMMAAKRKPLEILSSADLGLDPGFTGPTVSQTEVLQIVAPPMRPQAQRVDDEASAAQAIVDFLIEKEVL